EAEPKAEEAKTEEAPARKDAHVILVSDLDMISDIFFDLRRRPTEAMDFLNFDNIAFVLNCVDTLAGDESFVALRKRRPQHRTLLAVEELTRSYYEASQEESQRAEEE